MAERLLPGLERRLKAEVGEVDFGRFARGRYATDASHYQVMPLGVVVPRTIEEAERAIEICREEKVPVTPRGGGSSQAGQTVNHSVIVDCSKHLNRILDLDVAGRRARVQPGIVLDDLNRQLKAHGLWFPVDVSTASRATIGGMTANNSCGGRSLRYGNTRENVLSIDALLADGSKAHFGPVAPDLSDVPDSSPLKPLARDLFALGAREADEIAARPLPCTGERLPAAPLFGEAFFAARLPAFLAPPVDPPAESPPSPAGRTTSRRRPPTSNGPTPSCSAAPPASAARRASCGPLSTPSVACGRAANWRIRVSAR